MKKFLLYVLWILTAIGITYAGFETYNGLIVHWTAYFGNGSGSMQVDNDWVMTFSGIWGFTAPHGMWFDTTNQVVVNANSWYIVTYNTISDEAYGMYLSGWTGGSMIVVPRGWDYEFCFSAIADTDLANKKFYMRAKINWNNVPDSNTVVWITSATTEMVIAACLLFDMEAGDYFELVFGSDDAGSQLIFTNTGANPTRPASPSIITTAKRISSE